MHALLKPLLESRKELMLKFQKFLSNFSEQFPNSKPEGKLGGIPKNVEESQEKFLA